MCHPIIIRISEIQITDSEHPHSKERKERGRDLRKYLDNGDGGRILRRYCKHSERFSF